MDELFELEHKKIEDLCIVIKYEGPSFAGVMDIRDLGNELIGIEYCLKSVLKKLREGYLKGENSNTKSILSAVDIDAIEIVTEGFVDNCFLKKIKFKEIFDEVENRPELMKFLTVIISKTITVYGVVYAAQIAADSEVLKLAFQKNKIPNEVTQAIQSTDLDSVSRDVALQAIQSKKYRDESLKTITPLRDEADSLQIKSTEFSNQEDGVIEINARNKDVFLVSGVEGKDMEVEYERYDTVAGRISSIHLDATKNQIGFKVANEGAEIDCHLGDHLDIHDYQNGYLGEWVEIEGVIQYTYEKATFIKIDKITKIISPDESGQAIMVEG